MWCEFFVFTHDAVDSMVACYNCIHFCVDEICPIFDAHMYDEFQDDFDICYTPDT